MKWMTGSVLLAILWGLPGLAWAEENPTGPPRQNNPRTLQPIRLGMTRQEVRAKWGEPLECRYAYDEEECFDSGEYDWSKRKAVLALEDIYRRETATSAYDILVQYHWDRRRSHSHPDIRVLYVEIEPEHPVPVRPTLRDLPEALELCRSGCGMYGDIIGPTVMVYPELVTLRQRAKATLIANHWKPLSPSQQARRGGDWSPALELRLEEDAGDKDRSVQEIAWFERPIRLVILNVHWPRGELQLDRRTSLPGRRWILELDSFRP